jgi:hypothetical protein
MPRKIASATPKNSSIPFMLHCSTWPAARPKHEGNRSIVTR